MSVVELITLSPNIEVTETENNIEVTETETNIEIALFGTQGIQGPQGETGPSGASGTTNHTLLSNVGINTHAQIDNHIASKETNFSANTGSNVKFPTIKAVFDWVVSVLSGYQTSLGFGPANESLSNLTGVAVNSSINPDSDLFHDLGQTGVNWRRINAGEVMYEDKPIIDLVNRKLIDSSLEESIDFENRELLASTTSPSIHWKNRWLIDSSSNYSVDYDNRVLSDTGQGTSLDWRSRFLQNSSGGSVFNWANTYPAIKGRLSLSSTGSLDPEGALHIDSGTSQASFIKLTAGTTTGQTSLDGFDIGITLTGIAEIRQRENLNLELFTGNTLRAQFTGNGNLLLTGCTSVQMGAGTEAAPFLSFGSTNAGIYGATGSTLGISTTGISRLFFTATGELGIGTTTAFGGGVKNILAIQNCTTPPSSNPATGGVLYVQAGALKYRGSSGTTTTLASA